MTKSLSKILLAGLFALSGVAHAAVGLYNTGVDNAGVALTDNAIDTHYTVDGGTAFVATSAGGYPIGPWLGDSTTSAWITPSTNTNGNFGQTYAYQTSFDLTGIDLSTASISGRWASDDPVTQVRLNGVTVPSLSGGSYASWVNFSLTSGFQSGINTLAFDVLNSGGGPTGLRVEFTDTHFAAAVPEPESYALVLAGLLTVGFVLRRRG